MILAQCLPTTDDFACSRSLSSGPDGIYTLKNPICTEPHLSVSLVLPLKQLLYWSGWQRTLITSRQIIDLWIFLPRSPLGNHWCDVPDIVPTGSVSSSSQFQISQMQATCGRYPPPPGRSAELNPSTFGTVDPQKCLWWGVENGHMPVLT